MNFITGLAKSGSNKFDSILVVVDSLTNMAYYIPTYKIITAEQVTRLYLDNIFRLHGLPDSIVSDRGT